MKSSQKGLPREATLKAGEAGQSLLELIIVIAVSTMIVGALAFATIFSIRNAQLSKNQSQATKLAQEGIERVRTGRDRNSLVSVLSDTAVNSWSDTADPIWNYQISGNGRCDDSSLNPPGKCYFNVDSTGKLTGIGFAYTQSSLPLQAEGIPSSSNPIFKRAILLSDDLNHDKNFTNDDWRNQKEITVIVTWTDFSCRSNQFCHESRLTTILRKL